MKAEGRAVAATPEPVAIELGRRIAALRTGRGMSLQQVGELTGMSGAYVWRVEDGRQNLSLRNIARFASAFDIPLSELFDGVDGRCVSEGNRGYATRASPPAQGA